MWLLHIALRLLALHAFPAAMVRLFAWVVFHSYGCVRMVVILLQLAARAPRDDDSPPSILSQRLPFQVRVFDQRRHRAPKHRKLEVALSTPRPLSGA